MLPIQIYRYIKYQKHNIVACMYCPWVEITYNIINYRKAFYANIADVNHLDMGTLGQLYYTSSL